MTCKPRPISGNLPFDAIKKYIGSYCGKIIGDAGSIFGRFIVNFLNAVCVRDSTRTVLCYGSTSAITDGQEQITIPKDVPAILHGRWVNTAAGGATLGSELIDDSTASVWTPSGANTVTDVDGGVQITHVDSINGANLPLRNIKSTSADLVIGQSYSISLLASVNTGSITIRVFDGIGNTDHVFTEETPTGVLIDFVAQSTTGCQLICSGMSVGEVALFDEISLKTTTPFWSDVDINGESLDSNPVISVIRKASYGNNVALGDSLTFPGKYQTAAEGVNTDLTMANAGDPGDQLWVLFNRFQVDIIDAGYSSVFVFGGVNDLTKSNDIDSPVGSMKSSMTGMIDLALANGLTITVSNITPFGASNLWNATLQTWLEEYNDWLEVYAPSRGVPLFDGYSLMRDGDTINVVPSWTTDGLHFTDPGYVVYGEALGHFYTGITSHTALSVGLSGSNASTADDVNTEQTPIVLTGPTGAVEMVITPSDTAQSAKFPMASIVDSNNFIDLKSLATAITFRKDVGGVVTNLNTNNYVTTAGLKFRIQIYWDNILGMGARVADASVDIEAIPFTTNANVQDAPLSSVLDIGNRGGVSLFVGDYESMICYTSKEVAGW